MIFKIQWLSDYFTHGTHSCNPPWCSWGGSGWSHEGRHACPQYSWDGIQQDGAARPPEPGFSENLAALFLFPRWEQSSHHPCLHPSLTGTALEFIWPVRVSFFKQPVVFYSWSCIFMPPGFMGNGHAGVLRPLSLHVAPGFLRPLKPCWVIFFFFF